MINPAMFMLAADAAGANSAAAADASGAGTTYLIMQAGVWVLIIGVFYLIFLRPQRKKEKETAAMRKNLQIGDEVTTTGGIIGIVVRKNEDTVVIETGGDRSKIRIKTWAIAENATIHDAVEEVKIKK